MDKYNDLHNKTIFDFCDDIEVLKKLEAYITVEFYGKDGYIERCKKEPLNNSIDLDELSWAIHDPILRSQVKRQFKEELEAHFTE